MGVHLNQSDLSKHVVKLLTFYKLLTLKGETMNKRIVVIENDGRILIFNSMEDLESYMENKDK